MRIIFLLILLGVLAFCGCQEEKPEMFTHERFIKFMFGSESGKDYYKIECNFAYESDTTMEKIISVPVEFRGYNLTKTLYFAVNVDKEKTTLPEDCFILETEQPFQQDGDFVDTMHVKLQRKAILKEESKILRLKLVSNSDFQVYMTDSLFVEITVLDIFSKPEWWTDDIAKAYLGDYSKEKYDEFVKETGIRDFGDLDPSEKRYYAIMFKRALKKAPRYELDGSLMSVTITG